MPDEPTKPKRKHSFVLGFNGYDRRQLLALRDYLSIILVDEDLWDDADYLVDAETLYRHLHQLTNME